MNKVPGPIAESLTRYNRLFSDSRYIVLCRHCKCRGLFLLFRAAQKHFTHTHKKKTKQYDTCFHWLKQLWKIRRTMTHFTMETPHSWYKKKKKHKQWTRFWCILCPVEINCCVEGPWGKRDALNVQASLIRRTGLMVSVRNGAPVLDLQRWTSFILNVQAVDLNGASYST